MGLFSKLFKRKKMAKKFDIIVHDNDLDHTMHAPQEVKGVMAGSAQELIKTYEMCDQTIEIVREYEDTESQNYGKNKAMDITNVHLGGDSRVGGAGTFMKVDGNLPAYTPSVPSPAVPSPSPMPSETRYFEIGGIKCKMENGKMYQKQWMRLTEGESSEFRIVSDKNNKICPIKDKHIEVMKWVAVEDENKDSSVLDL